MYGIEMSVSLVIIFTVAIALISRWYIRRNKFVTFLANIPGPPPLPIIGNALDFKSSRDVIPTLMKYKEKYGGIVKVHIGVFPNWLIVNDYKLSEFLLSSTKIIDKSPDYRLFQDWLGDGLIFSSGEKWKKHKKILTPAFHFKVLEKFIAVFESNSEILINKLKKEIGKTSFDIFPYISLCTLDNICESAMGISINAQEHSDSTYVNSVKEICRIFVHRIYNPFYRHTFPYIFTKQYWMERKYTKFLHNYTNSIIKKRKEEFEKITHSSNPQLEDSGVKKRLAFLDLLLEERRKGQILSDLDIREEVDNFLFAGHDTTASATSFTLFCLAEYPEIQRTVVNELCRIFQDDKFRNITLTDLQEMKYMEAVIKETLRIYTTVPYFGREVKEDVEYNGIILPKGLTLCVFSYGLHHNPDLFPDPEKFLPERFFSGNAAGKLPYGYIPFSAGPRNCIGQKFAVLEIKSMLATILRNFEVVPANPKHELKIVAEGSLKSTNGICVQLKQSNF